MAILSFKVIAQLLNHALTLEVIIYIVKTLMASAKPKQGDNRHNNRYYLFHCFCFLINDPINNITPHG